MEESVRPPAVAGSFYPGNAESLREALDSYLSSVKQHEFEIKAMIVPHAGYMYSAPIAATAYKQLEPTRNNIKKVILLGPAHTVAFQGIAIAKADYFATPLGKVALDKSSKKQLTSYDFVLESDVPHEHEHCLEVQLPFIQRCLLENIGFTPLVVGEASANQISEVLGKLYVPGETLILVSSDLSHYLNHKEAQKIDSQTAKEIESLDSSLLNGSKACGFMAIKGLLHFAKQKNWQCKTLDLRDSSDTAGDKNRVVGYGAFVFYE